MGTWPSCPRCASAEEAAGTKNKFQLAAKLAVAAQRGARLPTVPEEPELDEDEPPEPPATQERPRKKQRQAHASWDEQATKRETIHYFYSHVMSALHSA